MQTLTDFIGGKRKRFELTSDANEAIETIKNKLSEQLIEFISKRLYLKGRDTV